MELKPTNTREITFVVRKSFLRGGHRATSAIPTPKHTAVKRSPSLHDETQLTMCPLTFAILTHYGIIISSLYSFLNCISIYRIITNALTKYYQWSKIIKIIIISLRY